jgi:ATP-dependent protease ClpP protease subunit
LFINIPAYMPKIVHVPIEGIIGSSTDEFGYPVPGFEAWMLDYFMQPDTEKVVLHINSGGGSVTEGFAIYNKLQALQENGIEVESIIEGRAYSIATVVALAASKVRAREASMFMVHKPWLQPYGANANELRKMADGLDSHEIPMLAIYTAKTGKPTEEITGFLAEEKFLSASEAKAYGFIDEVLPVGTSRNVQHEKKAIAFYTPKLVITDNPLMKDEEKKSLFAEFLAWFKTETKAEAEAPVQTPAAPAVVAASTETENGTLYYEGETLEVGTLVFADEALTEAAPDGEYPTSENIFVVVEGQVTEVKPVEEEAPADAPAQEAAAQVTPDVVSQLKQEINALKAQLNKPTVPGSGQPQAPAVQNFAGEKPVDEPFAQSAANLRNKYKRK